MSLHRRNPRRDSSEPEVVEAFRSAGATVQQLSGEGVPDLLVGYLSRNWLVEVKTGNARLRPTQEQWIEQWNGGVVDVARNAAQARKLLTVWSFRVAPRSIEDDLAEGVR